MRRLVLPSLLIACWTAGLMAQGPWPLAAGQRVRLETDSGPWIGTVVGQDSANLQLRWAGEHESTLVVVPQRRIQRVEVSAGRESNIGKGATIGGALGAGLGLVAGIACASSSDSFFQCSGGEIAAATLEVGFAGAFVGGLIGAASTHERWQPVAAADHPHLTLGVGRNGVRLGVSLPI